MTFIDLNNKYILTYEDKVIHISHNLKLMDNMKTQLKNVVNVIVVFDSIKYYLNSF